MLQRIVPALLVTFLAAPVWSVPVVLYDNLDQLTTGASFLDAPPVWEAQQFLTGSQAGFLTEAILPMIEEEAGQLFLEIYSSSLTNLPVALVGSLASIGTFTDDLDLHTFSGSVALDANSSYFVVLRATSGVYRWGFTNSLAGDGPGFSTSSASTIDSGSTWNPFNLEPYQMRLTLENMEVPELDSSAAPLALSPMAGMLLALRRKR